MPSIYRTAWIALALAMSSPAYAAGATSAVIEFGANGERTLLECNSGFMPVITEGPTDEFFDGQRIHSANGVRKCVAITGDLRDINGGSSASVMVTADRRLDVVNCPSGTVPLAWRLDNYKMTVEPKVLMPKGYLVVAPVVVRCINQSSQ